MALSAGVQRMVRSDLGAAGVMFTLDTESGFRDVVFITACYGLGETVVQGAVNPDEFYVHKPMLESGQVRDPAPQPGLQGDQDGVRDGRGGRSTASSVDGARRRAAHRFSLTRRRRDRARRATR